MCEGRRADSQEGALNSAVAKAASDERVESALEPHPKRIRAESYGSALPRVPTELTEVLCPTMHPRRRATGASGAAAS